MRDEEYEFFSDCREKKSIANSAFKQRTHCGKGGRVRLPSDNLTKKELEKMSGECKSYRMNEPMSYKEFRAMPDDIQVMYIKLLKQKLNVSVRLIAEMLGIDQSNFGKYLKTLGLDYGHRSGRTKWDKEGWYAWVSGTPKPATEEVTKEIPAEVTEEPEIVAQDVKVEIPNLPEEEPAEEAKVWHVVEVPERKRCIPTTGNMVFEGLAEDVLETVRMLLGGAKVHISVTWDVVED